MRQILQQRNETDVLASRDGRGANDRERGFSLLLVAVSATVLIGMLGLAFDLGRMFIVKNELQAFVDASAIAACRQMDGTQTGIQSAHTTAASGPLGSSQPNGWNFDTNTVANVTDTYATSFTGTYDAYATASSVATNNYRFVNVTANATVPLYFMGVLPGLSTQQTLQATATGGQKAQSSVGNGGLEPFMPDGHNNADLTNFGFVQNGEYTLKWGSGNSGNGKGSGSGNNSGNATTTCANDLSWTDPNPASQHGYVDLGQGNGNSSLNSVIVYGGYPNANSTPSSISTGSSVLQLVPGNRGASIFSSLVTRAAEDTDQSSLTWAQYQAAGIGNGRRVITVPVGDPTTIQGNGNGTELVMGFANFLLEPSSTYSGGSSGPICAIYIGPGNMNAAGTGGTDGTKVYSVMLYQ